METLLIFIKLFKSNITKLIPRYVLVVRINVRYRVECRHNVRIM